MTDVVVGDHKVLGSRPNYMHPMTVRATLPFMVEAIHWHHTTHSKHDVMHSLEVSMDNQKNARSLLIDQKNAT